MDLEREDDRNRDFLWRVSTTFLIGAAFVAAALVLWKVHEVLLLLFAGVLVSIFLRGCANAVARRLHVKKGWALAIVIFGILLLFAGIGFFLAPSIVEEVEQLKQRLPMAFNHAVDWVRDQPWGKALIEKSTDTATPAAQAGEAVSKATQFFSNTFEVVARVLVILVVGLYLAADPMTYIALFLRVIPRTKQFAAKRFLVRSGRTLRSWLIGQLVCMVAIGVCIGLGLRFMGVHLAGALGFVAGFFEFIPTVGPILSAVPAILLSFLESPVKALYVIVLFVVVQFIENHTLVPLVQAKAIDIPPVILIVSLLVFSTLFGFLGLFLATPLAAVIAVVLDELLRRQNGVKKNRERKRGSAE